MLDHVLQLCVCLLHPPSLPICVYQCSGGAHRWVNAPLQHAIIGILGLVRSLASAPHLCVNEARMKKDVYEGMKDVYE